MRREARVRYKTPLFFLDSDMTGAEKVQRLLEKRAAYEKKKAEWAAIAAAKHKARLKRKKENKRRHWKENYRKIAQRLEAERLQHFANGDNYGNFVVLISEDKVKKRQLFSSKWESTSLRKFNKYVKEHNDDVWVRANSDIEKEILLVRRKEPDMSPVVTYKRDDFGRLISVESANSDYVILSVANIYDEAEYTLYDGRSRRRCNAKDIYERFMESATDIIQICVSGRCLIVKHDGSLSLVAGDDEEAISNLYFSLERKNTRKDNVFFTGTYPQSLADGLSYDAHIILGIGEQKIRQMLF